MKKKALKACISIHDSYRYRLPFSWNVLWIYDAEQGFFCMVPFFMSMFIFAGSMEFVTANLLLSAFSPIAAFFLALVVNARHLFYGLSMLAKYKNIRMEKILPDLRYVRESFTVNCTVTPPDDVDRG